MTDGVSLLRNQREIMCEFYSYSPTKVDGGGKHIGGELLHKHSMKELHKTYTTRHPTNILCFTKNYGQENFHPTQKPTELLSYLLTYSQR